MYIQVSGYAYVIKKLTENSAKYKSRRYKSFKNNFTHMHYNRKKSIYCFSLLFVKLLKTALTMKFQCKIIQHYNEVKIINWL